jgi:hypothetical protein
MRDGVFAENGEDVGVGLLEAVFGVEEDYYSAESVGQKS